MKKKGVWMAAALVLVLAVLGTWKYGNWSQKSEEQHADRLMEAAYKAKDYQGMMAVADSLEEEGSLSAVEANYWRGYASDRLKRKDEAERYWRVSMAAGERAADKNDFVTYAKSASRLANMFTVRGDYEETLKLALPAVRRLEEQQCDTTSDYVNLLIYIGCCQAVMGKDVIETQHGFYLAYKKHKQLIDQKHTDASYKDAIAGLINVAYYCVKAGKYQDALYYTRYFGELLGEYELRPGVSASYIDRQLGRYDIYKAQALDGLGRKAEAAEAFAAFLDTEFSGSPEGLTLANEYRKSKGEQ